MYEDGLHPYAPAMPIQMRTQEPAARHWVLFQRDDCSLCDQALALLARVRIPELTSVFIDGDAVMEARYGRRVPVLRDECSGQELDWPFDVMQLQNWLR